jgi:hypothetical protein
MNETAILRTGQRPLDTRKIYQLDRRYYESQVYRPK